MNFWAIIDYYKCIGGRALMEKVKLCVCLCDPPPHAHQELKSEEIDLKMTRAVAPFRKTCVVYFPCGFFNVFLGR